ncbi:STP7 [Scenedesmus sp. PABB004]|nr:STP7 [Scenedesmus sp. PABB004]
MGAAGAAPGGGRQHGAVLLLLRNPLLLRATACTSAAALSAGWVIGAAAAWTRGRRSSARPGHAALSLSLAASPRRARRAAGIWGGVTSMPEFHARFFGASPGAGGVAAGDAYCLYKDQLLSLSGSCIYLAALPAVLLAAPATRKHGRRPTMWCGAVLMLASAVVGVTATSLGALFACRVLGGAAMGLAFQAPTMYLAELTPPEARGAALFTFNVAMIFGALLVQLANQFLVHTPWGWRLSIGLSGLPSLAAAALLATLPESPQSLLQRGRPDAAVRALEAVRRRPAAELAPELAQLREAADRSAAAGGTFERLGTLLTTRTYLPELFASCLYPNVLMFSGMNVLGQWMPNLMIVMGATPRYALTSSSLQWFVGLAAMLPAVVLIDRLGRRTLLAWGTTCIIGTMAAVAALLAIYLPPGTPSAPPAGGGGAPLLPRWLLNLMTALLCLNRGALSATLHPLAMTVPAEVQPLEVRSDASSITTMVRNGSSFIIVQWALPLLCAIKYGLFLVFCGCTLTGGLLIWALGARAAARACARARHAAAPRRRPARRRTPSPRCRAAAVSRAVPETKQVEIEAMRLEWARHWFWSRFAFVRARGDAPAAAAAASGPAAPLKGALKGADSLGSQLGSVVVPPVPFVFAALYLLNDLGCSMAQVCIGLGAYQVSRVAGNYSVVLLGPRASLRAGAAAGAAGYALLAGSAAFALCPRARLALFVACLALVGLSEQIAALQHFVKRRYGASSAALRGRLLRQYASNVTGTCVSFLLSGLTFHAGGVAAAAALGGVFEAALLAGALVFLQAPAPDAPPAPDAQDAQDAPPGVAADDASPFAASPFAAVDGEDGGGYDYVGAIDHLPVALPSAAPIAADLAATLGAPSAARLQAALQDVHLVRGFRALARDSSIDNASSGRLSGGLSGWLTSPSLLSSPLSSWPSSRLSGRLSSRLSERKSLGGARSPDAPALAPHPEDEAEEEAGGDAPSWISCVIALTFCIQALLIGTILSSAPVLLSRQLGLGVLHVGFAFAVGEGLGSAALLYGATPRGQAAVRAVLPQPLALLAILTTLGATAVALPLAGGPRVAMAALIAIMALNDVGTSMCAEAQGATLPARHYQRMNVAGNMLRRIGNTLTCSSAPLLFQVAPSLPFVLFGLITLAWVAMLASLFAGRARELAALEAAEEPGRRTSGALRSASASAGRAPSALLRRRGGAPSPGPAVAGGGAPGSAPQLSRMSPSSYLGGLSDLMRYARGASFITKEQRFWARRDGAARRGDDKAE